MVTVRALDFRDIEVFGIAELGNVGMFLMRKKNRASGSIEIYPGRHLRRLVGKNISGQTKDKCDTTNYQNNRVFLFHGTQRLFISISLISSDVATGIFFAGFTARIAKPHKINAGHRPPAIKTTNYFFNENCHTIRRT
jgi:hypothetical protein